MASEAASPRVPRRLAKYDGYNTDMTVTTPQGRKASETSDFGGCLSRDRADRDRETSKTSGSGGCLSCVAGEQDRESSKPSWVEAILENPEKLSVTQSKTARPARPEGWETLFMATGRARSARPALWKVPQIRAGARPQALEGKVQSRKYPENRGGEVEITLKYT